MRTSGVATLLLLYLGLAAGQVTEDAGFGLNLRVDGTHNEIGLITRVDATAGYRFNRYLAVDAGLPVYLVRPSAEALPLLTAGNTSGIGNLHASVRLTLASGQLAFSPSLTVAAPTGSEDKGLSTGRFTWDWNNLVQRSVGRVTPYGAAGVANTVTDTPFFVRPFTSRGVVTHFEGGALVSLTDRVSVGASGYAIQPSGEQTVLSRLAPKTNATPAQPPAASHGRGNRNRIPAPFETAPEVTGPAEIARDRGASLWVALAARPVEFHAGYSRSTTYQLDTVFFGFGIDLGHVLGAAKKEIHK